MSNQTSLIVKNDKKYAGSINKNGLRIMPSETAYSASTKRLPMKLNDCTRVGPLIMMSPGMHNMYVATSAAIRSQPLHGSISTKKNTIGCVYVDVSDVTIARAAPKKASL